MSYGAASESNVEASALAWLGSLGWSVRNAGEILEVRP